MCECTMTQNKGSPSTSVGMGGLSTHGSKSVHHRQVSPWWAKLHRKKGGCIRDTLLGLPRVYTLEASWAKLHKYTYVYAYTYIYAQDVFHTYYIYMYIYICIYIYVYVNSCICIYILIVKHVFFAQWTPHPPRPPRRDAATSRRPPRRVVPGATPHPPHPRRDAAPHPSRCRRAAAPHPPRRPQNTLARYKRTQVQEALDSQPNSCMIVWAQTHSSFICTFFEILNQK